MKKHILIAIALIAVPTASRAERKVQGDDQFINHDCADDDTVTIVGSQNFVTVTGACKQVTVAGAQNHVTIESGSWREDLQLAPGEERRITLPIEQPRNAALLTVTTTSGFRPSVVDPRSRDDRFLGVLVRVPGD